MARTQSQHTPASDSPTHGRKWLRILLGSLCVVTISLVVRYFWSARQASADPFAREAVTSPSAVKPQGSVIKTSYDSPAEGSDRGQRASATSGQVRRADGGDTQASAPAIVAAVNNKRITRDELGRECLRHYGKDVLESMVNKQLIVEECRRQGATVTRAEVDAEIERMAGRFKIPVEQWLKLIKQERGISPDQYANDIVWSMLALKKLAGSRLTVSREELQKEFETEYGSAIQARLIAANDLKTANDLRAQAVAHPDQFGNLAKKHSVDAPSASMKGLIQPIRMHGSYDEIENAVFNMRDGEISPVIHVGGQYVILFRERALPAAKATLEQVAPQLEEILRERKMRTVSQDIFRELQQHSKVENIWNDPAKHRQTPGVAALVDGAQITIRELAEECIARHGKDALEGLINHKLIELECQKRNITITEADLNEEIARAAAAGVPAKKNGAADVEAWLDLVTKKQGISMDIYRNDIVWPSAAIKKLVGQKKIEISEEDLRKGFEANYGPKVRCLAIVLNNQRRAQQVFEMARKNNTPENFGDLAAQYSIEPGSRELRGEVPPIRRHGGQPALEEEAFSLKPGEMSGIIQVGDQYIILRCEGFTDRERSITFEQVRDYIYQDIYEKKLRIAMGDYFENLQESATIDNFLAGTSHSPKRAPEDSAGRLPMLREVPGG